MTDAQVPALQALHWLTSVALAADDHVPGAQDVHWSADVAARTDEYVPLMHDVQDDDATLDQSPALQTAQALGVDAPDSEDQ